MRVVNASSMLHQSNIKLLITMSVDYLYYDSRAAYHQSREGHS
jgi:hypothetical protein